MERLEAVGIPCGPINEVGAVFEDEHVRERKLRIELPHPEIGQVPGVANPIRMSGTPVRYRHAPPMLGQHTFEIIQEGTGLTREELLKLEQSEVIEQWRPNPKK